MIVAPDESYRLICAKRGRSWQVEMRAGGFWAVGDFADDLDAAIQSAREKFAAVEEEPKPVQQRKKKPSDRKPATDLSDLFA